jgi:hypothetical protein
MLYELAFAGMGFNTAGKKAEKVKKAEINRDKILRGMILILIFIFVSTFWFL